MINPPQRDTHPISDEHLSAIGAVVVVWSLVEMAMETAICGLYEISTDRGMVLTANIGFRSRVDLLRILATKGAIANADHARDMVEILSRIEKGYAERNAVAHGWWSGTRHPKIARRMSIRAKGRRLVCSDEKVPIGQLLATRDRLDDLRRDFSALLRRLDLRDAPPLNGD
jgi:hypothetical protein